MVTDQLQGWWRVELQEFDSYFPSSLNLKLASEATSGVVDSLEVRTELRSELNCRPEDSNGGVGGDEESDEECDDNDSDDIEINI